MGVWNDAIARDSACGSLFFTLQIFGVLFPVVTQVLDAKYLPYYYYYYVLFAPGYLKVDCFQENRENSQWIEDITNVSTIAK